MFILTLQVWRKPCTCFFLWQRRTGRVLTYKTTKERWRSKTNSVRGKVFCPFVVLFPDPLLLCAHSKNDSSPVLAIGPIHHWQEEPHRSGVLHQVSSFYDDNTDLVGETGRYHGWTDEPLIFNLRHNPSCAEALLSSGVSTNNKELCEKTFLLVYNLMWVTVDEF